MLHSTLVEIKDGSVHGAKSLYVVVCIMACVQYKLSDILRDENSRAMIKSGFGKLDKLAQKFVQSNFCADQMEKHNSDMVTEFNKSILSL